MRKYVGILRFDNGVKIPSTLEATDRADALLKLAQFCNREGYFPVGVEIIDLFTTNEIITIK